MTSIYDILAEIRADNSKLAKIAILTREKDNQLLKRVLLATFDPFVNYWQKKIPVLTDGNYSSSLSLDEAITHLYDELVSRKVTGTKAINRFRWILQNCSVEDAEVIAMIVSRDLRAGFGVNTTNKVWKNFIPKFEVQLAHKDISGIRYPAYAQVKYDGMRCHLEWDGEHAVLRSRAGKEINLLEIFDDEAIRIMQTGDILDGELLVKTPDGRGIADRKTGNGILNKAVKGTITKEEAERVFFMAWDKVDVTSTIDYDVRFNKMQSMIKGRQLARIMCVDEAIVDNAEQAQAFYEKCIGAAHEGAVIKNMKSKWVPKRTKDLGKMKAEEEADLIVVGWEEGTGKNAGLLGALVCETADGKLRVNVGIGFSFQDRVYLTAARTIGRILTVKYNQLITDKKKETASLFLPRFIEWRGDKLVANTLDELK